MSGILIGCAALILVVISKYCTARDEIRSDIDEVARDIQEMRKWLRG